MVDDGSFRILTLTGGGFRGLYTAKVLEELENEYGYPIGRFFNLIAGTSIGGILALAVAAEIPMSDVVKLFEQHGDKIFKKRKANLFSIKRSTYSIDVLKEQLEIMFKEDKLGSLKHNVIIPAINFSVGKPVVFKTPHHHTFKRDKHHLIVDVALATSAAPIYFPKYVFDNTQYVDGGLFANNPSMLAIHEAQYFLNAKQESILLLNVGTLSSRISANPKTNKLGGMLDWAHGKNLSNAPKNIIELTLSTQQQMMTFITQHLLKERYLSIDENLTNEAANYVSLDRTDAAAKEVLLSTAMQNSKEALGKELIKTIFLKPVELHNTAIQPNTEDSNE